MSQLPVYSPNSRAACIAEPRSTLGNYPSTKALIAKLFKNISHKKQVTGMDGLTSAAKQGLDPSVLHLTLTSHVKKK